MKKQIKECRFATGLLLALLVCGLFWFTVFEAAADVKIRVINATNRYSMNRRQALAMLKDVKARFKNMTGERLVIRSFRSVRNPFPFLQEKTYNYVEVLATWSFYVADHPIHFRGPTIIITPPFNASGIRWLQGATEGICSKETLAFTTSENYNVAGELRYDHSVISFLHELGHVVGADHDNTFPVTIMNANMLPWVDIDPMMRYSALSLTQIHSCLEKWGTR